jgi:tellurite resistance protein
MMLPKGPFLALAAIGWADGSLQRIEAVGLLHAAKQAGLSGADLAQIEAATKQKTKLDDVDLSGMSQFAQVFTYALAVWFAQLDGVHSNDEQTVMVQLAQKLGLADSLCKRASAAAYDIVCLPEAGRPERYDFAKLADRLAEKMPQLKRD